ncbi:MAG: PleD family two-component response regulator, partial [Candidatus Latescibacterota bacterium]
MSRVFLLLQNRENRRQLDALLSERYEIAPSRDLNEPFDLIIVDGPSFQQRQSELDQRKKSEDPLFLPLLLLAPSQDKRALTQRLWQYVDDVIVPPIEKVELLARIEMLLRTRQLSLNLEVHSRELQKRYEELDELRLV